MKLARSIRALAPAPALSLPADVGPPASKPPGAEQAGTWTALAFILLTGTFLFGTKPSDLGRVAAIGSGIGLVLSAIIDFRAGGVRNLIRADLMAILAFYFLTFFEFLFPQPDFDMMIGPELTRVGIYLVLTGLAGLLIGRHLWRPRRAPLQRVLTFPIPAGLLILLFWACFVLGFAHMVIAVNGNIGEMLHQFMEPRFSQPWQRGRLGDWKALLVELGLLIFLIPPIAGIVLARRHRFNLFQIVPVIAAVLLVFFFGFTGGTRNVFCSYLVTLLIGYAFALPAGRKRELLLLCFTSAVVMFFATFVMLEFRTIGFRNWLKGNYQKMESRERTLFVDYNLFAICKLVEIFPDRRPYLGWEIPYNAIIRPIPRALWRGKPEGLSTSIEDALGVSGLTIAASFVGEAYMAGGFVAVLLTGLFFGTITGWWSSLASTRNSELGILIYASGFFAAVISMRSLFVFTTALLPTLAAVVGGIFLVRRLSAVAARITHLQRPRVPAPRR